LSSWKKGYLIERANIAATKIYSVIKDAKGPIVSSRRALRFSAREIYIQLFHFAGYRGGDWNQRLLLDQIEKRFSLHITEFSIEESKLGPDETGTFTRR